MKIDFVDDDNLIVYYISEDSFDNEEYIQLFIKMLDRKLRKFYDYDFRGYYDVGIHRNGNITILEFERESDYGKADFDITVYLNSTVLFEFEDDDYYKGNKLFFKNKYYVNSSKVDDRLDLFEFGNIVYGKEAIKVLDQGILICEK